MMILKKGDYSYALIKGLIKVQFVGQVFRSNLNFLFLSPLLLLAEVYPVRGTGKLQPFMRSSL